ncbi:MAG TPA: hypothetical protein VE956_01965 [Nodularia sp. (in: cyanobacteria)]|nr:hypothetical protein [Nodularia sp. (in: cyanobacteria)]
MKHKDVDEFEKLSGQLQGVYDELSVLSKKSPNDAVNKFKLKFINQLLNEANKLLGYKYLPFKDFSEFDIDEMPQNSDVVFILSQYLQCLEKLHSDNVIIHNGSWNWMVEADGDKYADEFGLIYIKTTCPKHLKK